MANIKVQEEELRCKECKGTGFMEKQEAQKDGFRQTWSLVWGVCDNCGGSGYAPDVPMEKRNIRYRD